MSLISEQAAEDFLAELEEEYYQNGAGLKGTLDLSPIYDSYAHLFTRARIEDLLAGREARADRYLARFAAFQYLANSARALTEEITDAETQAVVEWDGEAIAYRQAQVLLSTEPDRARRLELHRRLLAVVERQNPRRVERLAQLHGQAESLGFGDYVRFCDELLGFGLDRLAVQTTDLLSPPEA